MDMLGVVVILLVTCLTVVSICLGLVICTLITLRRRDTEQLKEIAKMGDNSGCAIGTSTDDKSQLDRIEEGIRETNQNMRKSIITNTRFSIMMIALTAVLASVTVPTINDEWRLFLFVLGFLGILAARFMPVKWIGKS